MPLDKKELKILLDGLNKQTGIHSMLNLVLCTGMSLEDCLSIHLSTIDYSNNKLIVFDSYLKRPRNIKLPSRVMELISLHQNGHNAPEKRLYEITQPTADNRLYELSKQRLDKGVTWSAIRRSWALLAFEKNIRFKDMVESSGASPEQLAKWSLYKHENDGTEGGLDLLVDIYNQSTFMNKG